jgi:hypothetical protein
MEGWRMTKLTIDALPTAAKNRLIALDSQRLEADDGQRAAQMRLASLPRTADPAVVQQLNLVRDKWNVRSESLSQLCNKIRFWIGSQNTAAVFEMAPAVKAGLHNGLTICKTIEEMRSQIEALQNHLRVVRTAPEPKTALKEKAAQFVHELAAHARPRIGAGSSGLTVAFSAPNADTVASHADVAALLTWLDPAAMTRALEKEIDALPQEQTPMPKGEQIQRAAELASQLLELERCEVALITAAQEQDGLEILHRQDCDPRAVLGITVAVKQRAGGGLIRFPASGRVACLRRSSSSPGAAQQAVAE